MFSMTFQVALLNCSEFRRFEILGYIEKWEEAARVRNYMLKSEEYDGLFPSLQSGIKLYPLPLVSC